MALDFLSPLHKASRQIGIYLEDHTRELGVSLIEGHVLTYLASYSPTPIGDLVRIFGIKQSTFTSMIDRLEKADLLRREINREDRRSFLIEISDPGREIAERMNLVLRSLEEQIRGRLTAQEVEGFRAVMGAVEEITRVRLRTE